MRTIRWEIMLTDKKGTISSFATCCFAEIFIVIFISTSFLFCQLLFVVLAFLFREHRDNVSQI